MRKFSYLKEYFNLIFTILQPRQCLGCNHFTDEIFCEKCDKLSSISISSMDFNQRTYYFFVEYNKQIKIAFSEIKFNSNRAVLFYLKSKLLQLERRSFCYDYWVPVPYHLNRLKRRGFNLIKELFADFFDELNIPCLDLLNRYKNTKPLFDKPINERKKILNNAFSFSIDPTKIKGKRLLLVDDIVTSGSTVKECIKTLETKLNCKVDIFSYSKVIDYDKKFN